MGFKAETRAINRERGDGLPQSQEDNHKIIASFFFLFLYRYSFLLYFLSTQSLSPHPVLIHLFFLLLVFCYINPILQGLKLQTHIASVLSFFPSSVIVCTQVRHFVYFIFTSLIIFFFNLLGCSVADWI